MLIQQNQEDRVDMSRDVLEVKWKGVAGAKEPYNAHRGDAGSDLRAGWSEVIHPGGRADIGTGIMAAIPVGYFGAVLGRSSLARKGIVVFPGTVDAPYRGEIVVTLFNFGNEKYSINRGDRIAQILVQPVKAVKWTEVDELDETDRGTNGFGSTGR